MSALLGPPPPPPEIVKVKRPYEEMDANERTVYHADKAVRYARWSIAFAVIAVLSAASGFLFR